jgi:hypothetical protein
MLALDSPVIAQGSYSAVYPSRHRQFAISTTESGAIVGTDALFRIVQEIDRLWTGQPANEDTPTRSARDIAIDLLSQAQIRRPFYVMATTVEGSEGDLLIHWDTAFKSVVLICPSSTDKAPQVYQEVLEGKKARHSEIHDASPTTLSDALAWVLQPR